MSKKSKQTQQQNQSYNNTTSYAYQPGASSPDIDSLRNATFDVDPSIASNFAAARNRIANTFNNPIGGDYTPAMRDAILRSSYRDLGQQQAETHSQAYNQNQGARFGQRATVASMTAPKLVSTGSSGTGAASGTTTMVQPFDWAGLATGAASGAAA